MFEGIDPKLAAALAAGYRAMCEGVGDVRAAEYIHNTVLKDIYHKVYTNETAGKIVEMANNPDIPCITVYENPEFADRNGNPLVIRMTRYNTRPVYIPNINLITIPIIRMLAHSGVTMWEGRARNKPLFLKQKVGLNAVRDRMNRIWKEKNSENTLDAAPLKEVMMRLLTRWYDHKYRPESVVRDSQFRTPEDELYRRNLAKQAEGKTVNMSYYDAKDRALPPVYRTSRMAPEDARELSARRMWATSDCLSNKARVARHQEWNKNHRKPENHGIDSYNLSNANAFDDRQDAYKHTADMNTNESLHAKISGMVPWLIKKRMDNGTAIDEDKTVDEMMQRIFDIVPDGEAAMHELHMRSVDKILPGAERSADRRCRKLIRAVNALPIGKETGMDEAISMLRDAFEKKVDKSQAGRLY